MRRKWGKEGNSKTFLPILGASCAFWLCCPSPNPSLCIHFMTFPACKITKRKRLLACKPTVVADDNSL